VGFGAAVGKVVEEGAGGSAGIVGSQLFQDGPLKSFHQFPVRFFCLEPVESQPQEAMESTQIGIRFRGLLNGLGKVSGGKDAGVRLSQARARADGMSLPEVVEGGPAGGLPADLALVEKVQVAPHGAARFGRPLGKGTHHPVAAGEPDGQQAGLPLSAEMKQNPFILKRLAQGLSLAEGANREDKRDDSAGGKV
jgi:hypothetical protein